MFLVFVNVATVSVVLALVYFGVSGWAYRRPWALMVLGAVTSLVAVALKASVNVWKDVSGGPWSAGAIDIAASVLDPTLVGLSGGLIGSAILLRAQFCHKREVRVANELAKDTSSALVELREWHEEFRQLAPDLSNEEFKRWLIAFRPLIDRAIDEDLRAKKLAHQLGSVEA